MTAPKDSRLAQLIDWADDKAGKPLNWQPASADASFRRYFRGVPSAADAGSQPSWIAVDAPPEREDNAAFVRIAGLMAAAGLNVPRVLAQDLEAGFLLLSDLGTRTYLHVLTGRNADALFEPAIAALLDWQQASAPGVLVEYDRATLAAELDLFPEWYLARHCQYVPDAQETATMRQSFAFILDNVCAQAQVFVHRDFMPRNLMVCDPMPGVLDFQDARFGPVTYDIACLFRDAFVSWPDSKITAWLDHYWREAKARAIPVPADWAIFERDVALMGVQRHLKVLGIFARIAYRDGKPGYLADTPRFIDYLRPVLARFDELAGLAPLLEHWPAETDANANASASADRHQMLDF